MTTSTSPRFAPTITSTVGRRRTARTSASTSGPAGDKSESSSPRAPVSTTWYLERGDRSVIKLHDPRGLRITYSRGETRVYSGMDKDYSAAFTDIVNAWAEGIDVAFIKDKSAWVKNEEEIRSAKIVEETIKQTVKKAVKKPPSVPEWLGEPTPVEYVLSWDTSGTAVILDKDGEEVEIGSTL